ncbi:MAG: FecCD family ABC transporter permease [Actinomycetes bacterium]
MRARPTALRVGAASVAVRPRSVTVAVTLVAVGLLVVAVGIGRGDYPIALPDVLRVLAGGGEAGERFVVLGLRLPRALTGLLVGAALGVAGALTQSVSRNPLASPDVLGVTAGASAGAVAVIVVAPAVGAAVGVPAAALAGGLAAGVALYALAWRRGLDGFRLVLVGVGINAFCTSLVTWFLVLADLTDAARATVWLNGSLNGAAWDDVPALTGALGATLLLAVPAAFALRALTLGDESAAGLGIRVDATRAALLVVAVVLASVATAAAGPVPFVALVAPQIALRLARTATPPLVVSALVGACLLTAADVLAQAALSIPLPVGVVTGVLGAPYLLYLIRSSSREATA